MACPSIPSHRPRAPRALGSLGWALALLGCSDGLAPPPATLSARRFAGGDGTVFVASDDAYSQPLPLLDREQERRFFRGQALFRDPWVVAPASTDSRDGLGPLFNARACSDCHPRDGRGRPPSGDEPLRSMFLRVGVVDEGGAPASEPTYGEQIQPFGIPGVQGEGEVHLTWHEETGRYADGEPYALRRPSASLALTRGDLVPDARTSLRVARQLVGLGLLEAIADEALDAAGGRSPVVADGEGGWSRGRIGWRADMPNTRHQTAKAFHLDLGLTSQLFPEETCTAAEVDCAAASSGGHPELLDRLLDNVAFYTATLAVPAPRDVDDPTVQRGFDVFQELGCDRCHVPHQITSEHPTIAGLADQSIWPFTDLRLHDMGEGLADERPLDDVGPRDWRTPPLWGIGLLEVVNGHLELLHDGRARGFAEAVLWHGGEATAARDAFTEAASDDRRALLRFLESL
ncbi:MAG: di-heme oxidoredictase family protein [Polyangiaceae bacterium]